MTRSGKTSSYLARPSYPSLASKTRNMPSNISRYSERHEGSSSMTSIVRTASDLHTTKREVGPSREIHFLRLDPPSELTASTR